MTAPDAAGCAAPGCTRMPARGLLCAAHYERLGQTLAQLADAMTADAAPALVGWSTGGGHSGGLASERDPGNLRLMHARADAAATLAAWADWLREARQLAWPTVSGWSRRVAAPAGPTCPGPCPHPSCAAIHWRWEHPAARNADTDRRLLATHLDWICNQPEVRDFWCQLRALWSTLRGHRPVRRCTCEGPVWSDRGAGWCSWCAASWAGTDLLNLPRHVEAA